MRFKRILAIFTILTLIIGGLVLKFQTTEPVSAGNLYSSRAVFSSSTSNNNTNQICLNAGATDNMYSSARILLFVTWHDPDGSVAVDYIDGNSATYTEEASYEIDLGGAYLKTRAFISNSFNAIDGGNSNCINFTNDYLIANLTAISFTGIADISDPSGFGTTGSTVDVYNLDPTNSSLQLAYIASLDDLTTYIPGDDTSDASFYDGDIDSMLFYPTEQSIEQTTMEFSSPALYELIQFRLNFINDPYVQVNASTYLEGDVTITGLAKSLNGEYHFGGCCGFDNINRLYYRLNGGSAVDFNADTAFDHFEETFTLVVPDVEIGDSIEIYTESFYGIYSNPLEVIVGAGTDPILTIDNITVGGSISYIDVDGSVTDNEGDLIDRIFYTIDGGSEIEVEAEDLTYDEATEEFSFRAGPFQNGTIVDLVITAENELGETDSATYENQLIQNSSDRAECLLSNHPTPTSDQTPIHTVSCTSPDNIEKMEYTYYNFELAEVYPTEEILVLDSGSYGSSSVSATITPDLPLPDQITTLRIIAYTSTGRFTEFDFAARDQFIIEAVDDSAPTIKLNPILPDPISSNAPYITGSCQDVNPFDTNSNIALMEYRIDAGAWLTLPPRNAPLDSHVEYFSYQLPVQALGEHDIEIRCADADGESTDTEGTNQFLEFEVIVQPDVDPEKIVINENFLNNDLNSINETTAIWGNGYVRLKEKMTYDKEILDSTNYPGRYDSIHSIYYKLIGNGDDVWYAKQTGIYRYNTVTEVTTPFLGLVGNFDTISDFKLFEHNGEEYIAYVSSGDGVEILEVSSSTQYSIDNGGFDSALFAPRGVDVDPRNPNIGLYINHDQTNGGEDANTYYIDLNGTVDNSNDDSLTWYSSSFGYNLDNTTNIFLDADNDVFYMPSFNVGLIRIDDNGTPLNLGDDTRTFFDSSDYVDIAFISGIEKDPTTDDIFIITHYLSSSLLLLNTNDTPANPDDDTFVELADQFDLYQQTVDDINFLAGPQYIGGQLFLRTRTGSLIYYSTNATYTDDSDDTSIILYTNEGLYPEYISGFYIHDYNTIYANFQRTGFTRLDLNRSWEDTGDAVTITIPPEVRLVVNNINIEDVIVGPLLEDEDGSTVPNNDEVGIQYFISLDDGVNYTEVDKGQLNYILDQDYRLKLKISLTKIGLNSQTPIIDSFTIAYGAYRDTDQTEAVDTIDIAIPDTSFYTNENFTVTITAYDALGYVMQNLDTSVSLQLQYFDTSNNVSALTPITLNLVNGVGTINNAQINIPGAFKIVADLSGVTDESVQLTVTNPPVDPEDNDVIPTLSFVTDKVTIKKGDSALLMWTSTNLTTLLLNGANVSLNGNLYVSPTETTTYTMFGTDPDDDTIAASLTIIVEDEIPVSEETEEELEEEVDAGTDALLSLIVPTEYIEFKEGEKVRIEWQTTGNPDSVFIDYQNANVTNSGFFEFYPQGDMTVTITARRGSQIISKVITIKLVTPSELSLLIPALVAAAALIVTSFVNGGFFYYISIFVGFVIFKRRKYWGVVYNASKLNKIPFATIRVYKKVGSQKIFVTQTISDLEGKYGIPVNETGEYTIEFIHEAYRTEIRDLIIQKDSDIILDIGMFEIDKQSLALFTKMRIFFKEQAPAIMQFMRVIVLTLMLIGAYITIQVIQQSPSIYNYIVLVLYLATIFVQGIIIFNPVFNTKRGRVLEVQTNRPIKGAVFRILYTDLKATYGVENIAMTNDAGVLKIRIKAGTYNYQISRTGYETDQGKIKIDNSGKILDTIFMNRIGAQNLEGKKFGEL